MSAVVPLLPTPLQPLAPGEALVLWALRLGAAQPANGPVIDQELSLAYGPLNGPAAAGALGRLAGILERHGRRTLRLAHPAEGVPTPDERCVLMLLAASQARDWALRDALLLWLVLPAARDAAAAAAITLGAALKQGGHALPPPVASPTATPTLSIRAVP